jgi:RNase P protein component
MPGAIPVLVLPSGKKREHMRLMWQAGQIRPGADVVVIARDKASGASYATLSRALDDLLKRGGLLLRRKEEAQ